jgi:hypothetical protein
MNALIARRLAVAMLAPLAPLAASCATHGDAPRSTSRDSAGVEIVTTVGTVPAWRLAAEPVVQLGTVDGDGPTQLFRVSDVELLADGGLVVANRGSEELRIFDANGAHRASVGRKGQGPEEFDGLSMVESYADSLLTYDEGNQRFSVRRLDGRLVRTFQLAWVDGLLRPVGLNGAAGAMESRGILGVTARYMSQLEGTGLVVDTALVSLYDLEGALIDSLTRLPHNERVVQRVANLQTTLGLPYSAGASIVGDAHGFCTAFGPAAEIRCRDGAGLRRVARLDLPLRPVTEAHVATFWDEAFDPDNPRRNSALRRMRAGMPFPTHFPAFAQLARDDRGRIWARRYATPDDAHEEWVILDDGRWIGRLASPTDFRVMDVRGDRLAGVWQDSLGIEYVRVYRYQQH